MFQEISNRLILHYQRLKELPKSKERDTFIRESKAEIKNMMTDAIIGAASLGEAIGWNESKKILRQALEFIDECEKTP